MARAKKIYKIQVSKRNVKIVEGTLEYLLQYFSYTFEIGQSWNKKINRRPKTIDSFVSNLQKSYDEKEASCYERTSITLI